MKKILFLSIPFFISTICNSQNLNLDLLDQISTISFVDIDNVMIDGYGFKKMREENGEITYMKVYDNNFKNTILIKIINSKKQSRHTLDVKVGSNFSIRKIKDDLVQKGFLFLGLYDSKLYVYNKDDVYYLIPEKPNDVGAHQIMVVYNLE